MLEYEGVCVGRKVEQTTVRVAGGTVRRAVSVGRNSVASTADFARCALKSNHPGSETCRKKKKNHI